MTQKTNVDEIKDKKVRFDEENLKKDIHSDEKESRNNKSDKIKKKRKQ